MPPLRRIELYGKPLRLQGGPWTLVVYRREFGADLLQDLQLAYGEGVQLSLLLQTVWALCVTADDKTAGYDDWLQSFGWIDLSDAAALAVMDSAISAELFRRRQAGRIRRLIARFMGRVSKHLGSLAARLVDGRDKNDVDV